MGDELTELVNELPQGLKLEVSLFIHEDTYKKISFLNESSSSFIAWICPLLRPLLSTPGEYIYFEADEISCIYFLKAGDCGFVLPRHNNIKYIDCNIGCFFGVIDIVGGCLDAN